MAEFLESSIFPLVLTLAAFRVGQRCQEKWKSPILNPILTGALLVALVLLLTGMDPRAYKAGMEDISWLITPVTIALAIPMYSQYQVLKKNLAAIAAGVAAGALSCLLLVTAAGLMLKLDRTLLISLMPKSVTTAIGAGLSEMSGGLAAVSSTAIIVTGIFANMMGMTFCRWFRITDPVAQGVAFGTAGHVIGTAKANELDPLTGAVSSLSLVVAGLLTAVVFPAAVSLV